MRNIPVLFAVVVLTGAVACTESDPAVDSVGESELTTTTPATPNPPRQSPCHPSYEGACLDQPGDYDCAGGSGNGPNYTGSVRVVGPDVYDLDRDGDGLGCE